jgi:hypothetical protein
MNESAIDLTVAEKRVIASEFEKLHHAIAGGLAEDDVALRAVAFQRAYRGPSRPLVDAFGASRDQAAWAREVRDVLAGELGDALSLWNARRTPVAQDDARAGATNASQDAGAVAPVLDDDVVAVDTACAHCGVVLTVRCAPMPGHPIVTEHELTCPACARLTTLDLPGAVVDVVADRRA